MFDHCNLILVGFFYLFACLFFVLIGKALDWLKSQFPAGDATEVIR